MPSCDISLLFINLLGKQYQLESQNQQRNNRSQADMHGITDNESESFVISSNGTATTLALYYIVQRNRKKNSSNDN